MSKDGPSINMLCKIVRDGFKVHFSRRDGKDIVALIRDGRRIERIIKDGDKFEPFLESLLQEHLKDGQIMPPMIG